MTHPEKISTILGDVLIPSLGFFLWDWNIYFISLFFILDQVAKETGQLFRLGKLKNQIDASKKAFSLHFLIFIALILVIHLFNYLLHPSIQFFKEMNDFFWYKDAGVAQGFILFPLLIFVERTKHKIYMKTFSAEMHRAQWKMHTVQMATYLLLFLVLCLIQPLFKMGETWSFLSLIFGFALVTLSSDKLSAFFPR
jgi:hypothetical protein